MISNALLRNTFNFLLFQALWFLCVLRADAISAGLTLLAVLAHLILVSQNRGREARFIVMGTALGVLLDTFWQNLGVLRFPLNDGAYAEGLIPVWLMAIWGAFLTTLSHSLSWIRQYALLPWLLAPVAGPLAYYAATALGPLKVGYSYWGYAVLALGWALVFPLQLRVLRWLEQMEKPGHA